MYQFTESRNAHAKVASIQLKSMKSSTIRKSSFSHGVCKKPKCRDPGCTFWRIGYGSKGNRTKSKNSSSKPSLSPKTRSGDEFSIISSTLSHPNNSSASQHQSKIALRTRSSEVTVKSGCCKKQFLAWDRGKLQRFHTFHASKFHTIERQRCTPRKISPDYSTKKAILNRKWHFAEDYIYSNVYRILDII